MPFELYADYAHQLANDPTGREDAIGGGLKIGTNKKKGDASLAYLYEYVEANAVLSYFSDSDFGGSNRKGHVVSVQYNLTDNCQAGVTVLFTNPVDGTKTDNLTAQADLVWKW